MSPLYDIKCDACAREVIDVWQDVNHDPDPCACGGTLRRAWLAKSAAVIGDDIPGGLEIANGLCHPDGTPQKFYSKTEIRREEAKRGYTNHVVHIGEAGSDKSKHTTRWF